MATKREVTLVSRTYAQAAELMWNYYVSNKTILKADVNEYRDFILQELMSGKKVEAVFKDFVLPIEVIEALFKQAQKLAKTK
jgi:hypothetical protein